MSRWKKMFVLPGHVKTVAEFSAALIVETGEDVYHLEDQEAFEQMIKDGWITYENNQTIFWRE